MDVRGGSEDEIESPAARLATARDHGRRETSPFTSDLSVDGQWIECCLDHREPLRATRSLVIRVSGEDTEMELCE